VRTDAHDDRDPMTRTALSAQIDGRHIDAIDLAGDDARAAIVLLHEGLGSVGLWRDVPDRLRAATGRRVIAFSRFGHGRSDRPPRKRDPAFFHEEALHVLPRLLEQWQAPDPLLVGHSDGASIALIHAANHRVAGVTLLAPHVFVEPVTVAAIEQIRRSYAEGDLRDRMSRHHDDVDAAFWGWCDVWLDPTFLDWTLDDEAGRLACPTLLVQGVDDPYGTLAQLDRIESVAPAEVRRVHVPGGHNPHFEAPDETLAAIAALSDEIA
jgi:pimeloyl-ACP methyl ester carboxylesterase